MMATLLYIMMPCGVLHQAMAANGIQHYTTVCTVNDGEVAVVQVYTWHDYNLLNVYLFQHSHAKGEMHITAYE